MIFYILDLLGVAVFAISGTLAAGHAGLDLFGVLVVAAITAIGGGTLRDLLMNRHPIFWMGNPTYLVVIAAASLSTILLGQVVQSWGSALLVADAFGLALFAISGAQIAEAAKLPPLVIILMGTMTGAAGGVMRDILMSRVPLILQRDIYATAAIAGICVYLLLQALGMKRQMAVIAGILVVAALRLVALRWNWQLPVFHFS